MKKSILQFLCLCVAVAGPAAFISFLPIIPSTLSANGTVKQRLQADNVVTTGKVLAVGPSTTGSSALRVLYSYDAPGYPRNGNPGSFQREQFIEPQEAAHFQAGMPVQVEYSHSLAGMSRLLGYGTGSVYVAEQMQDLRSIAASVLPFLAVGVVVASFLKRRRSEMAM